jgi:hypothetical protein
MSDNNASSYYSKSGFDSNRNNNVNYDRNIRNNLNFNQSNTQNQQDARLWIGGFDVSTKNDDLESYFQQYGAIANVAVLKNKDNERLYAFVAFVDSDSMHKVLQEGKRHRIGNSWVDVKKAAPRKFNSSSHNKNIVNNSSNNNNNNVNQHKQDAPQSAYQYVHESNENQNNNTLSNTPQPAPQYYLSPYGYCTPEQYAAMLQQQQQQQFQMYAAYQYWNQNPQPQQQQPLQSIQSNISNENSFSEPIVNNNLANLSTNLQYISQYLPKSNV